MKTAQRSQEKMTESKPSPGLSRVYKALRKMTCATRPELAEATGLSLPAVGTIVEALVNAGLAQLKDVEPEGRRGRPAQQVSICPEEHLVAAVDFSSPSAQIGLYDLYGKQLQQEKGRSSLGLAELGQGQALDFILECLRKYPAAKAYGVNVPGFVQNGVVSHSWMFEFNQAIDLKKELEARLHAPVFIENGVNSAAWGEYRTRQLRSPQSLVFLNFGQGVGAGLIIGGRLQRGAHGASGEVGLMPVGIEAFDQEEISLDHLGLHLDFVLTHLESSAATSMQTILMGERAFAALMEVTPDLTDPFGQVVERVMAGDRKAAAAIDQFNHYIALMLTNMVLTIDPDFVVLQNSWPHTRELFFEPIRAYLKKFGITADVSLSQVGSRVGLDGIALLAAESLEQGLLQKAR